MKKNAQTSVRHIISLILLPILMSFVLTACWDRNMSENASTDAPGSFTRYSCEEDSESKATVFVQLDINPSFILGMTADGQVISIEANNEDAENVMVNSLSHYFDDVTGGVELEYVLRDIGEAVRQCGYIEDTLNVSYSVLSGNTEGDTLENAFEQAAAYLTDDGITASFEPASDSNGDSSELQSENAESEDKTCDACNGEGTVACDLCNGTGTVTEIEEQEVEVRNDYVCPYCGGAGVLDDGMHGGETAVCGYCGGEGKTGSMSGEFREKAFDLETVEEEIVRPCSRCNGKCIMECGRCGGTGFID